MTIEKAKEILSKALMPLNKEVIFEKAHEIESSELARAYYNNYGLTFKDIQMSDYYKLSEFIQKEIDILLADKSYRMVERLRMNNKIRKDKYGVYLLTDGSYFSKREAIFFYNPENNNRDLLIGLCGWASGCNRIPYIIGFINWCDWMRDNKNKEKIQWKTI